MVCLYMDPNGEKIFTTSTDAYKQQQKELQNQLQCKPSIINLNMDNGSDNENNVVALKARIEELECMLKKMKLEESRVIIHSS